MFGRLDVTCANEQACERSFQPTECTGNVLYWWDKILVASGAAKAELLINPRLVAYSKPELECTPAVHEEDDKGQLLV